MKTFNRQGRAMDSRKARFLRDIGENLKRTRISKGIDTSEVSKALRMSERRLKEIEAGATNYNLRTLYEICGLYRVNVLDVVP